MRLANKKWVMVTNDKKNMCMIDKIIAKKIN
jgi:hypothetical protein